MLWLVIYVMRGDLFYYALIREIVLWIEDTSQVPVMKYMKTTSHHVQYLVVSKCYIIKLIFSRPLSSKHDSSIYDKC